MSGYIKSPLNYVGGKYKLLPQILPLFPKDIDTFVDVFAGGCNVGVNVKANHYIFNDIEPRVIGLLKYIKQYSLDDMLSSIDYYTDKYSLDRENKQGYLDLRKDYNLSSFKPPMHFYTLICHSFSNQIRFNSKGEFNMPFGKRTFNDQLKERFISFVNHLQQLNVEFDNIDFRDMEFQYGDFVYLDPPYLHTTATYNENGGWTEQDEKDLLFMLDTLDKSHIKFALSNVFENKGSRNEILIEWAKKYNVHYLNHTYSHCNYQSKDKGTNTTVEVLITNY